MRDHTDLPSKATLPSPLMLGKWWNPETSTAAYPDPFDAFADAAAILREEIGELADLGCRYVQIDATDIATLADPGVRAQYDGLGIGAERMLGEGVELLDSLAAGGTGDVVMGIHLCKGNSEGRFIAAGSYDPIAARVFPRLAGYDVLLLEYDDERSGGSRRWPRRSTRRRRARPRVDEEPASWRPTTTSSRASSRRRRSSRPSGWRCRASAASPSTAGGNRITPAVTAPRSSSSWGVSRIGSGASCDRLKTSYVRASSEAAGSRTGNLAEEVPE